MNTTHTGLSTTLNRSREGIRCFFAAALFLLVTAPVSPLHAQTSGGAYEFSGESTLSVEGTSTIHDWSCEVESFTGEVNVASDAENPLNGVESTTVTVPIDSFECGKNTMNRKLREAFKAEDHPELTFASEEITVTQGSSGSPAQLTVRGKLSMAGVSQSIEVTAEGHRTDDGRFRFAGTHELDMTEYEMDPPTAVFGTIRTGEVVTIHFDILTPHE